MAWPRRINVIEPYFVTLLCNHPVQRIENSIVLHASLVIRVCWCHGETRSSPTTQYHFFERKSKGFRMAYTSALSLLYKFSCSSGAVMILKSSGSFEFSSKAALIMTMGVGPFFFVAGTIPFDRGIPLEIAEFILTRPLTASRTTSRFFPFSLFFSSLSTPLM